MDKQKLTETYRNFAIKFYKKDDGTIYFENKFINGDADNIDNAFKYFSNKDWERELYYYYDDVMDVKFGTFEPALENKKYKGMLYLGKLNLQLDLNKDYKDYEHSIDYLVKHPETLPAHKKYVDDLKRKEKINDIKQKLKDGIKKVAGFFTKRNAYEMFYPEKTRYDLICSHCGSVIPTGCYYEEYHRQPYHLECIWDKICNGKSNNEYEIARKYFLSLKKYIGNWPPSGLDIEEDYLTDLDLVKINDRKTGLNEDYMFGSAEVHGQPTTSSRQVVPDSVTKSSQNPNIIITYLKSKIKR